MTDVTVIPSLEKFHENRWPVETSLTSCTFCSVVMEFLEEISTSEDSVYSYLEEEIDQVTKLLHCQKLELYDILAMRVQG